MFIKNRAELETSEARRVALELVEAGLEAIDTKAVIKRSVSLSGNTLTMADQTLDLSAVKRLLVVALGKCALDAAVALEEVLGDSIADGIVIDVREDKLCPLRRIRCFAGDHPFPTERNIGFTQEIIKLLNESSEQDLILMVVSGGASTLLCNPQSGTCEDEKRIVEELFRAGANIQELNIIRKHLSLARGGYLAQYAYPAQVVGLIFSDVPGDDLQTIASGPTVLDSSTADDALLLAKRYGLDQKFGVSSASFIETPKDEKYFSKVKNYLVVANTLALAAMAERARLSGYKPEIVDAKLGGDVRQVAGQIAARLHQQPARTVLLYGGETTVNIVGHGRGGRNQELALLLLEELQDDELFVSLASDGRDNSDAAGGLVDELTKRQAVEKSLAAKTYLADNNSYEFLAAVNAQLLTGQTGANVSDLLIALKN